MYVSGYVSKTTRAEYIAFLKSDPLVGPILSLVQEALTKFHCSPGGGGFNCSVDYRRK